MMRRGYNVLWREEPDQAREGGSVLWRGAGAYDGPVRAGAECCGGPVICSTWPLSATTLELVPRGPGTQQS